MVDPSKQPTVLPMTDAAARRALRPVITQLRYESKRLWALSKAALEQGNDGYAEALAENAHRVDVQAAAIEHAFFRLAEKRP